jgi:hypothetical protein
MFFPARLRLLLAALAPVATHGTPPSALAAALEYLRDQKSYSWEVINSDPGPVAQQFETRRGTITSVQKNLAPNVKGQVDRNGDMRIQRFWADGLQLETLIAAADGTMVTQTPEGWLNEREILTAQADERLGGRGAGDRLVWLRRADRPDIRRPDQELVPLLKSSLEFEFSGESYVVHLRSRAGDPAKTNADESEPANQVSVTLNLRGGVIRDYEVKLEGTRRETRSRIAVPVSEQRIVILTYVPIGRIEAPAAAKEKIAAARAANGRKP